MIVIRNLAMVAVATAVLAACQVDNEIISPGRKMPILDAGVLVDSEPDKSKQVSDGEPKDAEPLAIGKQNVELPPGFDSFNTHIGFDPAFVFKPPAKEPAAAVESHEAEPAVPPTSVAAKFDGEIDMRGIPRISTHVVRNAENIQYCHRIDRRLSSVTLRNCLLMEQQDSGFKSSEGSAIYYVHFETDPAQKPLGKVLVLGGVHGDELTSVSTVYLWIQTLKRYHSGLFDWRIVPLVNPDGFFSPKPQRTNSNGIDLNRNLPTKKWNQLANRYWKKYAKATVRKFPGNEAASEPETQWLVNEIDTYKPDVIISVHAPYNLVDYDAIDRSNAPRRLGILRGRSLGTFPGSLGRYAGEERNIPVITLELPHSGRMPLRSVINGIWVDLVSWLRHNLNTANIAGRSFTQCGDSLSVKGCI